LRGLNKGKNLQRMEMKNIRAGEGPQLSLDVTDRERTAAKSIKKDFKAILKELDTALKIVYDLRDALVEDRPSKTDIGNRFHGRFLRYRSKIVKAFNAFLENLKVALESLEAVLDPEMIKLRGLLMAEFDEMSDGIEALLDLLKNSGKEGFTKNLERICTQAQKRRQSIGDVIESQLFNHLEHDILGKLKISHLMPQIKRRTRLLRKLAMEG